MSRKRWFRIGRPYRSIMSLVADIMSERWVMLRGRPKHWRVMSNMALITLMSFIHHKIVRRAERCGS